MTHSYNETASLYNHIGNGGFTFSTFVEGGRQFLSIEMSHMGITQAYQIALNKHTIESLLDVLTAAKLAQQSLPSSYTDDLPHSAYDKLEGVSGSVGPSYETITQSNSADTQWYTPTPYNYANTTNHQYIADQVKTAGYLYAKDETPKETEASLRQKKIDTLLLPLRGTAREIMYEILNMTETNKLEEDFDYFLKYVTLEAAQLDSATAAVNSGDVKGLDKWYNDLNHVAATLYPSLYSAYDKAYEHVDNIAKALFDDKPVEKVETAKPTDSEYLAYFAELFEELKKNSNHRY